MATKKRHLLFVLFLALTVCLSTAIPTFATDKLPVAEERGDKQILSELSDDELLLFLEENGVTIPVGLADSQEEAMGIIRSLIIRIEKKPDIVFTYSLRQTCDFAYALKSVVDDYYGITVDSTFYPYSSHGLRDSTVYQTPSNRGNYNCYAYALGKTDSWYYVGESSGHNLTQVDIADKSIYEIATYVKADLQSSSLNKMCVKIVSARPSYSSLSSGQTAICVRKGSDGIMYDYHFMKLFNGDVWRHKPGGTAILTYDYLPSNSRNWTNESYDGSVARSGMCVYNSDIYYILFNSSHNYLHNYTGNNYHKGGKHYYEYADVCKDCGDQKTGSSTWVTIECSGPPCMEVLNLEVVD